MPKTGGDTVHGTHHCHPSQRYVISLWTQIDGISFETF